MSKRVFTLFIVICIVAVQALLPVTVNAYTARLYGTDRYRTAIAISQQGWSSSYYAVLARGDDFPDALCAGPLANKYNAPILLTETWRLNPDVLTELKRLGVSYVFIVGGTGALSQNVEYSLRYAGITAIERIYGSDRYETSARIAEKMGWPGTIALATGENFPDALSISAIAAKKGMPILLTGRYNLPYSVDQYIRSRSVGTTYVVGGTGVISEGIRTSLPNAVRLYGTDRFDTNMQIMKYFESELDFNNIYVAIGDGPTGDEFADALTGAVLASKTSSPLILTGNTLPWVTSNYIRQKVSSITKVTALGGEGVVPWSVVNSITNNTGYNGGYPGGYPGGSYTNTAATYSSSGTYGPYYGTNTVSGSIVISASDVTLQNTIIEGDLTLTESIYTGSVYLRNVTVRGTTYIRGGGPNSVVMTDFNNNYMVADVPNNTVRLLAQGNTSIGHLRMDCGGRIEEYGLSGNGFTTVVISDSVSVNMYGRFDTVHMESRSASLYLESGSISALNVNSAAYSSNISLSSDTYIDTLTLDAATIVSSYTQGQIYRANINSSGVYIDKSPTYREIRSGIAANIGGQIVTGSGSYSSSYRVTYSGNGNTGGSAPGAVDYQYQATVTVPGNTDSLVKTGYTFAGWNRAADGSGTNYTANQTFAMGAADITLYAKWQVNTYRITYNGNGNTSGSAPDAADKQYQATVTVPGNTGLLVKTGYTFAGWNTAVDGTGTTYTANQTFAMGAADITLYAKWINIVANLAACQVKGVTGSNIPGATGNGKVKLEWTALTTEEVTNTGAIGYEIYYIDSTTLGTNPLTTSTTGAIKKVVANVTTTTYTIEGLTAGKEYKFVIYAVDGASNYSSVSAAATKTVKPDIGTLILNDPAHANIDTFTGSGSVSGVKLFAFKLNIAGENAIIGKINVRATNVNRMNNSDLANLKVYIDLNNNGEMDTAEEVTESGSSGTIDNGGAITVTATEGGMGGALASINIDGLRLSLANSNRDIMIKADVAKIDTPLLSGCAVAFRLENTDVTNVTGATSGESITPSGGPVMGVKHIEN